MHKITQYAEIAWRRYCKIYPMLDRFMMPEIVLSNRLEKTAGYNDSYENRIILNARMLNRFTKNMVEIILPHELAHQVDFNLNGWKKYKRHHGKQWKEIMVAYGLEPEPYHTMEL